MQTEKIFVPGPLGRIETVIETPFISDKKLVGIICHPHPLYHGTMNNKVVTTVVKALQRLEIVSVRFNFRGVGNSEGTHDYSVGEQDDLKAIIAWCRTKYPDYGIILAGFSFGAYIAAKVATEIPPKALITIAPAVHHNDFENLPPVHSPWIVVQGDADEVVPPEQVFAWLASLSQKPIIISMPGASHFFHGHLIELREKLVAALASLLCEH